MFFSRSLVNAAFMFFESFSDRIFTFLLEVSTKQNFQLALTLRDFVILGCLVLSIAVGLIDILRCINGGLNGNHSAGSPACLLPSISYLG